MASFERDGPKGVDIWIVERRGRALWFRFGSEGNKGRLQHRECASDEAAIAAERVEIDQRVAEGWLEVDPNANVSGLKLVGSRLRRASRPDGTARRAVPSAIAGELAQQVVNTATARDALALFVQALDRPSKPRLGRVSFATSTDGGEVCLEAVYIQGSGENPDDYDEEAFVLELELEPLPRDDLEDEPLVIDVFAEDLLRSPPSRVASTFRNALAHEAAWLAVERSRVKTASVSFGGT
jgi:hypothetical protein